MLTELGFPANNFFKDWYDKRQGFARTGHGFYYNVFVLHEKRDCRGLYRSHMSVPHGGYYIQTIKDVNICWPVLLFLLLLTSMA
jgi:hypothetical protein